MSDLDLQVDLGPEYELHITKEAMTTGEFEINLTQETIVLGVGLGDGITELPGTVEVEVDLAVNVNALRAVTYGGVYCDQTNLDHYAGITPFAGNASTSMRVTREGLYEDSGWTWTPNAPIFISDQGVLTQTAPVGAIRRIGFALTATKVNLDPFPTIGV